MLKRKQKKKTTHNLIKAFLNQMKSKVTTKFQ